MGTLRREHLSLECLRRKKEGSEAGKRCVARATELVGQQEHDRHGEGSEPPGYDVQYVYAVVCATCAVRCDAAPVRAEHGGQRDSQDRVETE